MITLDKYTKANIRLEELLSLNDTNLDKEIIEVSDIIEKYEEIHFPIGLRGMEVQEIPPI